MVRLGPKATGGTLPFLELLLLGQCQRPKSVL